MNILIVSSDSFFISGAISLIDRAWPPNLASHPVFLVSEVNQSLLTPDIIISDVCQPPDGAYQLHPAPSSKFGSHSSMERHIAIFLAAQCDKEPGSFCPLHHIYLQKSEAAYGLLMLFRRRESAIFRHKPQCCGQRDASPLSKQQAMVVRYTSQGMSLTDISRLTHLSVKTISTHKRAVMRKLGIKNNSEFYQYALVGHLQK